MNCAQTIKRIRQALFLEQSEFGELLDMSKQSIWHYENGTRKPRIHTLRKIYDLAKKNKINITLEDLLNT